MRYSTPLRYPGGKSKLANFIKLVFDENNLLDGHYVEPYAGGAGLAFHLLFQEYASHIHINDLNLPVYAFWRAVLYDTETLCRLIRDTVVTVEEWDRQKHVQEHPAQATLLDLGFSTFFLNRTNRSGIIQGGVIGGRQQDGNYKIDARYHKQNLIARIEKVARYNTRVSLYNEDAMEFLRSLSPRLPRKTLIYLDPPYYVKGEGLYEDHYTHQDHVNVAKFVAKIKKQKWIVSYDNVPEICQLYQKFPQLTYGLKYSAAERYEGSEVMFFCNTLSIPAVANPANPTIQQIPLPL